MKLTAISWELNLVKGGHYSPFVYRDSAGIHIGDCDNQECFSTVEQAIEYAEAARLRDIDLSLLSEAAERYPGSNYESEYFWHEDAGLQLNALSRL